MSARTAELHRAAYLLTADQERAERLVQVTVERLRRDRTPLGQAGTVARHHMARRAATATEPSNAGDGGSPADQQHATIAGMPPRQRAVLMLRILDRYDERSTARELGISTGAVATAEAEAGRILGIAIDSDQCRTALVDFADRATWPDPAATLAGSARAKESARRPWWTYVAALVVVALTVTTVVVTQGWHKDWLRTPDGLNDAHGTHFPSYIQGYKLVTVREAVPGIAQNVTTGKEGAVALPCDVIEPSVRLSVQSEGSDGYEGDSCLDSNLPARLTRVEGRASAIVLGTRRHAYPIAVYTKIPRSEYPVATTDFDVQHNLTLTDARKEAHGGKAPSAAGERPVLTLHGTAAHHNGTFTGTLRLPPAESDLPQVNAVGLLSPTTTGRFRVRIDDLPPTTSCGQPRPPSTDHLLGCSLLDHRVPQITYLQDLPGASDTVQVQIVVKDARGPWTLQVVAGTYGIGAGSPD